MHSLRGPSCLHFRETWGAVRMAARPSDHSMRLPSAEIVASITLGQVRYSCRISLIPDSRIRGCAGKATPNSTRTSPPNSCSTRTACWGPGPDNSQMREDAAKAVGPVVLLHAAFPRLSMGLRHEVLIWNRSRIRHLDDDPFMSGCLMTSVAGVRKGAISLYECGFVPGFDRCIQSR